MVAATLETVYKIGDRVRLRKKPRAAFNLKRGDVIEIAAIHPVDGSIKFWNSQSDRWEFAYPDETGRLVDSVSRASTLADTEYTAEVADTEYTAEVADIDSVSKAISTYRPRGTARSGEYFRFSYRDGSRMKHIHIRGGNTDSPIAQAKVQEVRSLLEAGIPPAEIATMLRN